MASDHGSLNTHWKLPDYRTENLWELRKRAILAGHPCPERLSLSVLRVILQRADRGLLQYDECSVEELQQFAANRGISTGGGLSEDIKQLVKADENPEFHRFTDRRLPPELRKTVYNYYIAGFPETLTTPAQPPLARTCKLIRKEFLPVFYSQCTFALEYTGNQDDQQRWDCEHADCDIASCKYYISSLSWPFGASADNYDYRQDYCCREFRRDGYGCQCLADCVLPTHKTAGFLKSMTKESVGDIRTLQVTLEIHLSDTVLDACVCTARGLARCEIPTLFTYIIRLSNDSTASTVEAVRTPLPSPSPPLVSSCSEIADELDEATDLVCAELDKWLDKDVSIRDGKLRLSVEDIDRMPGILYKQLEG